MSGDILLGLLVCGALFLAASLLGALCLWWRWGAGPAARWWVRREPIQDLRGFPLFEGLALVLLPVFAETLGALGIVAIVGPFVSPPSGMGLVVLLVVVVFQAVLYVVAHGATWQRRILPLWAYPSWLRPQRRAEREWSRAHDW